MKHAHQDFRASYRAAHGCHMVIVEQYMTDLKQPSWRTVTNLFCADENHGEAMAFAINSAGHSANKSILTLA
jgi:hypothetical protein